MSKLNKFDFDQVCRTCLTTINLKSLYDKYANNLAEMLMICTPVEYYENDGLPIQICTDCITEINKSYKFALKCRESDEQLRIQFLNLLPNEHYSEISDTSYKSAIAETHEQEITPKNDIIIQKSLIDDDKITNLAQINEITAIKEPINQLNDLKSTKKQNFSNTNYKSDDISETQPEITPKNDTNIQKTLIDDDKIINPAQFSEISAIKEPINQLKDIKLTKKRTFSDTNYKSDDISETQKPEITPKNDKIIQKTLIYDDKTSNPAQINEISAIKEPINQLKDLKLTKKRIFTDINGTDVSKTQPEIIRKNDTNIRKTLIDDDKIINLTKINEISTIKEPNNQLKDLKLTKKRICRQKPIILKSIKGQIEEVFQCKVCLINFPSTVTLQTHELAHIKRKIHQDQLPERPYECTVCDKSFKRKDRLKSHMEMHTANKSYPCTLCNCSFNIRAHLTRHVHTHTKDQCYLCVVCGGKYSQSTHLKRHMRVHSGEKPFKCKVCDSGFHRRDILNDHMRIHTGEKPYACAFCSKTFNHQHHLSNHVRTHTGEKPFQCTVCKMLFQRQDCLKNHIRKQHTKTP